jgi:hypothetical protein
MQVKDRQVEIVYNACQKFRHAFLDEQYCTVQYLSPWLEALSSHSTS